MDQRPLVICIFPSLSPHSRSCWRTENSSGIFWKRWLLLCESLLGALAQSETQHTTGVCCMWEEEEGHWGNMYSKGRGVYKVGQLTHSVTGPFWCHADIITPSPNRHTLNTKKNIYMTESYCSIKLWINILLKSLERMTNINHLPILN